MCYQEYASISGGTVCIIMSFQLISCLMVHVRAKIWRPCVAEVDLSPSFKGPLNVIVGYESHYRLTETSNCDNV